MTDRTGPASQPPTPAAHPFSDPENPFRLNLEQQKKRAKDLLRTAKDGEPEALARIAHARDGSAERTSRATPTAPKLAEAQFAIARELRFPSWAKMKSHIASM